MAAFLSNRLKNLKVGITGYTDSTQVAEFIGNVDIDGSLQVNAFNDGISTGDSNEILVANGTGGWSWKPLVEIGAALEAGGSDGSFQYNNNTALGGASKLYYDDTNNRIGVNTSTPGYLFEVNGDASFLGKLRDKDGDSGTNGQILMSTGTGIDWVNAAPADAITGLNIQEESSLQGSANAVSTLNFVGSYITATVAGSTATITLNESPSLTGLTVNANSSTDAVRITQTGSGNAFVVEDSTNPDSSPFVIMADGKVSIGTTAKIAYSSSDTSTFGILASPGNDSAFVLKANNGSAIDGSGQTLAILVGTTGSSGSGTNIIHYSHDTSGVGTRRNSIRFTDTQIRFEDSTSGSVDLLINTSGSGEVLIGSTTLTGTASQKLQVTGGAYVSGDIGVGVTNPTQKLDVDGTIKTNNSVLISDCQLKCTTTTITDSSAQFTADTFAATSYRSTKYLVEVRETSTSNYFTCEVLLMHDGTEVYITQYGTLQTSTSPVSSIDADINSGNVRLLITPSVSNTISKISRISLTA
jgi:hypothetical protein